MATTKQQTTRKSRGTAQTRKRDRIVEGVKSRPLTAAAVATLAGAAGAAAYFLTRSKEDRPLMKWGQDADDTGTGAASPSARQADKLANSDTSTSASAAGGTRATAPSGGAKATASSTPVGSKAAGLDETVKDQTKVGSVAYGA